MSNVNETTNGSNEASVTNVIDFKSSTPMKPTMTNTTLKFNPFNDKNKEVVITLTDKKMELLYLAYEFKNEQELYDRLLWDMEDELMNLYSSFSELKHDYENYTDEIIDVGAGGLVMRQHLLKGLDESFVSKINSLLTTGRVSISPHLTNR